MRSHLSNPAYDDDGISSSEEEQDDEDAAEEEDDDEDLMPHLRHLYLSPSRLQDQVQEPESETALPSPLAPLDLTLSAQAQSEEPEPETIPPTTIPTIIPILTTPSTMPSRRLPKLFLRRNHHDVHAPPHADHTHRRSSSAGAILPIPPYPSYTASAPPSPLAPTPKKRFRKSWSNKKADYNFSTAQSNDIVGIVMLEIQGASDLPRLKNSASYP